MTKHHLILVAAAATTIMSGCSVQHGGNTADFPKAPYSFILQAKYVGTSSRQSGATWQFWVVKQPFETVEKSASDELKALGMEEIKSRGVAIFREGAKMKVTINQGGTDANLKSIPGSSSTSTTVVVSN